MSIVSTALLAEHIQFVKINNLKEIGLKYRPINLKLWKSVYIVYFSIFISNCIASA